MAKQSKPVGTNRPVARSPSGGKANAIASMYRNWLHFRKRAIGQELSEIDRQLVELKTVVDDED